MLTMVLLAINTPSANMDTTSHCQFYNHYAQVRYHKGANTFGHLRITTCNCQHLTETEL